MVRSDYVQDGFTQLLLELRWCRTRTLRSDVVRQVLGSRDRHAAMVPHRDGAERR